MQDSNDFLSLWIFIKFLSSPNQFPVQAEAISMISKYKNKDENSQYENKDDRRKFKTRNHHEK